MKRLIGCVLALACAMPVVGEEDGALFRGHSRMALAGAENAVRDARVVYLRELKRLQRKGALDSDPAQVRQVVDIAIRLRDVAVRLFPASARWDWDIHVASLDEVNAWCMAGGKMMVYSALAKPFARDDSSIAFAVGHEIAHALLEHSRTQQDRELYKDGVRWLLTRSFRVGNVGTSSLSSGEALARTLPMSREAELEADTLGLEIMSRAGYDPTGALRMLQFLAASNKGDAKSDFTATHPLHGRRISNIENLLPAAQKLSKGAKQ